MAKSSKQKAGAKKGPKTSGEPGIKGLGKGGPKIKGGAKKAGAKKGPKGSGEPGIKGKGKGGIK